MDNATVVALEKCIIICPTFPFYRLQCIDCQDAKRYANDKIYLGTREEKIDRKKLTEKNGKNIKSKHYVAIFELSAFDISQTEEVL